MEQKIDKKLEKIKIEPEIMNITAKEAVVIANNNKCLKDSIFLENLKNNLSYEYIGFTKFGVKRVKFYEETAIDEETGKSLYHERNAWYVKVLNGEWGATKFEEILNTNEINEIEYLDGEFRPQDNIACLIFEDNGEYLYLTKELIPYIFDINEKVKIKEDKEKIKKNLQKIKKRREEVPEWFENFHKE